MNRKVLLYETQSGNCPVNVEKLWELRITFGGKAFRVFFFNWKESTVILTSGFQKKTQKTPEKEIELAKKYMEDFLERDHENTR